MSTSWEDTQTPEFNGQHECRACGTVTDDDIDGLCGSCYADIEAAIDDEDDGPDLELARMTAAIAGLAESMAEMGRASVATAAGIGTFIAGWELRLWVAYYELTGARYGWRRADLARWWREIERGVLVRDRTRHSSPDEAPEPPASS